MYQKVVVTGSIIEIYDIEREPYNPYLDQEREKEKDDYLEHFKDTRLLSDNLSLVEEAKKEMQDKEFDRRESEYWQKLDRKEERRKQTLRDAKNKARRIALSNFNKNSLFVTLTYEKNQKNVKEADEDFRQFIETLNEDFQKNHKYLAVREFQDRGAVHYHMLIDLNITWDRDDHERREYFERLVHDVYWSHGWVDLKRLDYREEGRKRKKYNEEGSVDNVGAYIVKYMDIDDVRLQDYKSYLTSKGLERPKTYTGEEAAAVIKAYNLNQKKEVFTNQYDNEYLGKIVYREYNLNRE